MKEAIRGTFVLVGMMLASVSPGWGDDVQGNRISGSDLRTVNSGEASGEGEVTYTLGRPIVNWNVTSAAGNDADVRALTLPLVASAFRVNPNFELEVNKDLIESADVISADPQVVQYKIQPNAVWSDGTPISASDFVYIWKTHNGRDCSGCLINANDGYEFVSDVTGDDTGKVVTVTFTQPFVAWKSLFMFIYPSHLAEASGDLPNSYNDYLSKVPTWSGGPYVVESVDQGQLITMVPNPKWYGEGPKLSKLKYRIITDVTQQMTALENQEVDVVYLNGATQDIVEQAKDFGNYGINYQSNPSANWYYLMLNLKDPSLADVALRRALFTAIDLADIKYKTAEAFLGSWPGMGSVTLMPNQHGYSDVASRLGYGHGNVEAGQRILAEAGYTVIDGKLSKNGVAVPPLRLVYPTAYPVFANMARLIVDQASKIGINVDMVSSIESTTDYVLTGNYALSMNYFAQTPFPVVKAAQVWRTGASQNYGKFSDPTVDELINRAAQASTSESSASLLMEADAIIQKAAYVLPIYPLPTALIYRNNIVNLRDNPNQMGPVYNSQFWGIVGQD